MPLENDTKPVVVLYTLVLLFTFTDYPCKQLHLDAHRNDREELVLDVFADEKYVILNFFFRARLIGAEPKIGSENRVGSVSKDEEE